MNKDISLYYTVKLDEISKMQRALIENLKKDLTNMGEQGFLYDDGTGIVPIMDVNDGIDENQCRMDKIKAEDGVIKFHDIDIDEWFPLSMLTNEEINTIIEYIDWNY